MGRTAAETSVRSRVLLLALLACLLLAGAGSALVLLLRSNQTAEQAAIAVHLETVARRLARDYGARSEWSSHRWLGSGSQTQEQARDQQGAALSEPQSPGANAVLALMTAAALQHEPGVEGGFYASVSGGLVGYAFPTGPEEQGPNGGRDEKHGGPRGPGPGGQGSGGGPPRRESEAVVALAAKAVAAGETEQMVLRGPRDAAVVVAVPVFGTDADTDTKMRGVSASAGTPGAVWLMQRTPDADAGMRQRMLAGIGGFAVGGLACALIAYLVVAEVQRAVRTTAGYVEALGTDLAVERPASVGLAEFERVLREVAGLAEKLRAQQALERAMRTMEERLRHQDRLASLGKFAAGIAHELRNPLATVRLRLQMTENSSADESALRNGAIALEEIARMDKMIARLLYFSRPLTVEREVVDLEALCRGCLQGFETRLREQGTTVSMVCEGAALVMAETSQMRQVLDNVLVNALEALGEVMPGERRLACELSRQGDFVVCVVEDSGPGLSAHAVEHALDAFFTTKETGTGLGLAIAHEVLQVYGGRLQMSNGDEGGAVATLWLPAAGAGESG